MIGSARPAAAAANTLPDPLPPVIFPANSALRPGPLGFNPVLMEDQQTEPPVAIEIPGAAVDAAVEQNRIVDGVMLDPSGPWVVSWYEQTAPLGQSGNMVMSGHLDYWDIGPAVFYDLAALTEGDDILVTGESGEVFVYTVTWARLYQLEELNSPAITEIVGETIEASVTLITCGGDFDPATGQYLSRYVVRAGLASDT
jgi:hypothetical protein